MLIDNNNFYVNGRIYNVNIFICCLIGGILSIIYFMRDIIDILLEKKTLKKIQDTRKKNNKNSIHAEYRKILKVKFFMWGELFFRKTFDGIRKKRNI